MRDAYKRRPEDFKRRIIVRIYTSRQDLLTEEHRLLELISDHELGKRYYNLRKHRFGHWSTDKERAKFATEKAKASNAKRIALMTEQERKDRYGKVHIGKAYIKGTKRKSETIEKMRQANLGKKASEETKQKMSKSQLDNFRDYTHSEETRKKISDAQRGKSRGPKPIEQINNLAKINKVKMKALWQNEEYRKMQSEKHKGFFWITNGSDSMQCAGEIPIGFYKGRVINR